VFRPWTTQLNNTDEDDSVPVLGIETSCDETAVALVEDGDRILADRVASQEKVHAPFGGVVPELASRQHIKNLLPLLAGVLADSGSRLEDIELVGVTKGPGLAGCLIAGLGFAKGLAYGLGRPVLGVNHLEAHIYSCRLAGRVEFPAVALLVSGGHTLLVRIASWGRYELLGRTLDDAVGEAYDKVASMCGLGFPGGPAIEAAAKDALAGRAGSRLPRPLINSGDFNFSFSGLKTAVLYRLRGRAGAPMETSETSVMAGEFQRAVVDVMVKKTIDAARSTRARRLLLAGGVAQNEELRSGLQREAAAEGIGLICVPKRYCTDNAVMVAMLAARQYAEGKRDDWSLDIDPGLQLAAT